LKPLFDINSFEYHFVKLCSVMLPYGVRYWPFCFTADVSLL